MDRFTYSKKTEQAHLTQYCIVIILIKSSFIFISVKLSEYLRKRAAFFNIQQILL